MRACADGQAGLTAGSLPLTLCFLISTHTLCISWHCHSEIVYPTYCHFKLTEIARHPCLLIWGVWPLRYTGDQAPRPI